MISINNDICKEKLITCRIVIIITNVTGPNLDIV